MNSKSIIIVVLTLVLVGVLVRYVVFKDQIDEWGVGIERISDWEANYRAENPNATDEEVDAAFRAGIANIKAWKAQYLVENPGATEADADAAFSAAWDTN